jgi:Tfp pilus assembly protein PilV
MRRHRLGGRTAGTSLVEALVAMAIMAFGMLAVVGIQATLRLNADVAKQRSEAVRIAQEAMEAARGFSTIATTAGRVAYDDITDVSNLAVVSDTANTAFLLSRSVVALTAPDRKEISVRVAWTDRAGTPQQVELLSVIGANDPAVSLALGARPNGIPERQPLGRHPAIPAAATDMQDGTSALKPPGAASAVLWVFDNLTGVVVGVCNTVTTGQDELTRADTQACINATSGIGLPLSGYVRFATDMIDTTTGLPRQPTASDAENPASTARNLAVALALTSTGHPSPGYACYANAPSSSTTTRRTVRYYCVILFNAGVAPVWSGTSTLTPLPYTESGETAWRIADDADDATANRYRVCRYTPATSDAQVIPNQWHPRSYADVSILQPLTDQNFLVIRAGDGTVPFNCPTDSAANPAAGDFVNSNTLVQQPAP